MAEIKIDYDSIPRSYRDYLELMQKEGEYLAIDDEVDWNLELGAVRSRTSSPPRNDDKSPLYRI